MKGSIMCNGFLLLLSLCVIQMVSSKEGFLFTLPNVLRSGSQTEFCFTMFGTDGNLKSATMSLVSSDDGEMKTKIEDEYENGVQKCTNFTVPDAGSYQLLLYNSTDILHDAVDITVVSSKPITLVQTDKPMYKPGQMVKFRVLTLLNNLKPRTGNISSIYIVDPNDIRVKQFLNVATQGISSLEFQLVREAKLGRWNIEVNLDTDDDGNTETAETMFKVEEYVLPRFEVIITPPSYIPANAEVIEGTVCAKYTYGKPVEGFLDLKACWATSYGANGPEFHEVVKMTGCHNFSINSTELAQGLHYYFGAQLQVSVSVTEAGTGAVVNKTVTGPSENFTPLNIQMEDYTNGFFKPKLPYHGKIIVTRPDGVPAPNEIIEVTATDHKNSIKFSGNYTTDAAGVIVYALCDAFTTNTTSISISAVAIMYKNEDDRTHPPGKRLSTPRGFREVKQWFSPSLSYIQIPRTDSSHKCGDRLTLSIPFTTIERKNVNFKYQVMARGRIVKAGQLTYDHNSYYPGFNLINTDPKACLQQEEYPTPSPRPPMPTAVFVREDEDVEDEEDFEVEERAEEDEELDIEGREPMPGILAPYPDVIVPPEFQEPIVRSEEIATTVSNFLLHFRITDEMSPKFTLLVYHVMADGEVVADSMEFVVEPCFSNNVKMEFDRSTALPGEAVELKLEATPGSVCGVGVVDKSVNILGGKHQITMDTVFKRLEELSVSQFADHFYSYRRDEYCENRIKKLEGADDSEDEEMEYDMWHYSSLFVDALQAFKSSGFLVLSDLNVETRPCGKDYERIVYYGLPGVSMPDVEGPVPVALPINKHVGSNGKTTTASVRTNFPETWLWDIALVGETGQAKIHQETPHTVTSWVGNALCLDKDTGFGVSTMTSLTTFQPFFLSLHLPYAAVRNERLPIILTVYNYLEKCLHVQIKMDVGDGFTLLNGRSHSEPLCLCKGKSHSAKFYAEPTSIGSLPVIAKAEIIPGRCGNAVEMDTQYIGLSDAVKRQVLVKAEGVTQEYTNTLFMCSESRRAKHEEVILPLPEDIVEGSARGEVKVIGDIMGPVLKNLDNLVNMPTGCGEQNMVGFVPNIIVLKYLTNTGRLTEDIEQKAIKFMEIGYQRELKYKHPDGSYSAFGENDPSGSVWLTAFVVKSFAQAQPFVYIDQVEVDMSLKFLRRSAMENGCFRETGRVLSSYMMGGLGKKKNSPVALTSYVLIALLQANVNTSESVIVDAFDCINRDFKRTKAKMDVYSLAILAYANTLYEPFSHTTVEAIKVLESRAKKDGAHKYWGRSSVQPKPVNTWYYHAAPSAEVEMTAYALLAYINFYGPQAIARSHDIAMWLSKQRNPNGGFASTQDTVVGLNALSDFSRLAYREGGSELLVDINGKGVRGRFQVSTSKQTSLLLQTTPIESLPNKLRIRAQGVGCTLVQSSVFFNKLPQKLQAGTKPSFSLKLSPRLYQHDIDRCNRRTLLITVGTRGHQKFSNGMTLLTVRMLTGWTPIPDSLIKLESLFPKLGMKRYEYKEDEGVLTIYFDGLSRKAKRFSIDVEQDRQLAVSKPKDAEVKVFQYYETDVSLVKSYNLRTTCGTKQEIPRKPVAPIDPRLPMPVVQARVDLSRLPGISVRNPESSCPFCSQIRRFPENMMEELCNSSAVYVAVAGRSGAKPVKIRHNIRPAKEEKNINKFVTLEIKPDCRCPLVEPPSKRVAIFVRNKMSGKVLKLDSSSMVLQFNNKLSKEVKRLKKSCPLPGDAS